MTDGIGLHELLVAYLPCDMRSCPFVSPPSARLSLWLSLSLSHSLACSLSLSPSFSDRLSLGGEGGGVLAGATTVLPGDPVCPRSFFETPFPPQCDSRLRTGSVLGWLRLRPESIRLGVGGGGRRRKKGERRTIPILYGPLSLSLSFRAPCLSVPRSTSPLTSFLTVYSPPSPASSGPGRGRGTRVGKGEKEGLGALFRMP